jgi:hypothetical protein
MSPLIREPRVFLTAIVYRLTVVSVCAGGMLLGAVSGHANSSNDSAASVTEITIEADKPIGPIGNLYNVGYNGWRDITNPGMVKAFDDLGIKFCRVQINLKELCGEKSGDYHWDYKLAADTGVGFTERVKQVIMNGWTPLLAFSWHNSEITIPKWFKGSHSDTNGDSWTHYNLDGTKVPKGCGNQINAASTIARDVASHFAQQGIKGLWWETIYEMGVENPLVEIHHAVGKGIKSADYSAKIVGPATWPGWAVQERFVRPYFQKYGTDLVDAVSVHWYASCDHGFWNLRPGKTIMTMADKDLMTYLMAETSHYGAWTQTLHALIADKTLNRSGKRIGIIFSEVDVNADSYYQRNPKNPDWPNYRADADCWQNCNYFGGVWWASVLCHVASAGTQADVFKFNTRNFYGIQEVVPPNRAYRYPVWFAMKLLKEAGGVSAGRQMLRATVKEGGAPMVETFATGTPDDLRIIVINKSFDPQTVNITASGLADKTWKATQYLYDKTRVAPFIGANPADKKDGVFQGFPDDDSISEQSLHPIGNSSCESRNGNAFFPAVQCPPLSFVVLTLRNQSDPIAP